MLWAVMTKDLFLLSRDPVWRVVLVGYLVVFTIFSWLSYSDFMALEGAVRTSSAFWERLQTGHWLLLTTLTPWVVLRLGRHLWGDELVRFIAQAALRPWYVLLSVVLVSSLYLGQLLLLSLPYMALAERMGITTTSAIIWSYADLFFWLILVQWCTLCWQVWVSRDLPALLLAYLMLSGLSIAHTYLAGWVSSVTRQLIVIGGIGGVYCLARHAWNAHFIYLRS